MIFTTLQDAVQELKPRINGGMCHWETAVDRINQATRRIMNRPRKPVHVERVIRFFTDKDTITLPREVEKVLHYTMDTIPAPSFSQAYEFVSGGLGELGCGPCIPGKFLMDRGNHYSTMFDLPSMEFISREATPSEATPSGSGTSTAVTGSGVFTQADLAALVRDPAQVSSEAGVPVSGLREPEFSAFKLVAFSTDEDDKNNELIIYGRNSKNEVLGSPQPGLRLPINHWQGGVEGEIFMDMASLPQDVFVTSATAVRDVERVAKRKTEGFISLYTYDPVTYQMYFLSKYHPQETNPRYRRYRITSPDYVNGSSIYALCELGYTPLTHEDDILIVQNMDALKMMVMAIEFENEREFQAAKAYEADAYRLIEDQRTAERQHDYNLIQYGRAYGIGDVRAV